MVDALVAAADRLVPTFAIVPTCPGRVRRAPQHGWMHARAQFRDLCPTNRGSHRSGYLAFSHAYPALQSVFDRRTMLAVTATSALASACRMCARHERKAGRGSLSQRYSVVRPIPTILAAALRSMPCEASHSSRSATRGVNLVGRPTACRVRMASLWPSTSTWVSGARLGACESRSGRSPSSPRPVTKTTERSARRVASPTARRISSC